MKEEEQIYFNIWESQAEAEATARAEAQQEPSQEVEQEATATEYFIFSDGIKHNRNIEIIDNKSIARANKRDFKVIGKLSKAENRILRAIKK